MSIGKRTSLVMCVQVNTVVCGIRLSHSTVRFFSTIHSIMVKQSGKVFKKYLICKTIGIGKAIIPEIKACISACISA